MRLALSLLFSAVTLLPLAAWSGEVTTELPARFGKEIQCEAGQRDVNRHWCAVTRIGKDEFSAPKELTTYLGLTVPLKPDEAVRPAVLGRTAVVALHLGPSSARLTSLKASNPQEEKEMLPVLLAIGVTLKGVSKAPIPVSEGLWGYLQSEQRKPGYPLEASKTSAKYAANLPSSIYRVNTQAGAVYVVVETARDGQFVSVFPIVELKH